jgi:hypothetical protein
MEVAVGTFVDVGIKNGARVGFSVASWVAVRLEEWLRAVSVNGGTRVCEGVMVAEAVMVGVAEMSGVAVGVDEAVLVGIVKVGKGPSSASAVPAMAVFVAAASLWDCPPRPEAVVLLNVTA